MAHVLIGVNLLPRVTARIFCWLLPCLDGIIGFTVAVVFPWWTQLRMVATCKNADVTEVVVKMNVGAVSFSFAVMGYEYAIGFPFLVVGVIGPIVTGILGAKVYSKGGVGELNMCSLKGDGVEQRRRLASPADKGVAPADERATLATED